MAYVVTQPCCVDASCVPACPVNCIHPAPGESNFGTTEMLYIDAASCVGCGACVGACPVGAIRADTALGPELLPFVALSSDYYRQSPHAERTPVALVPPQRRMQRRGPFRIAVVGSGPAGLYTADELLKHPEVTAVHVFERLPIPHGLVRYGVAPDHVATKRVSRLFESIERRPGFRYFLGVDVGADVSLDELRATYDGVVWAGGLSSDRTLGIAGEDSLGVVSAGELVGWYNGHPERRNLSVPLDHERVVVVGNGNVALDIARMLTRDPGWLARSTNLAKNVADQLRDSAVREVQIIGRRGPNNASFTVPELIGLAALDDVDVIVDADPSSLVGSDQRTRLIADLATRPRENRPRNRRIVLSFDRSPTEIVGGAGRVTAIRVVRTTANGSTDSSTSREASTREETISAGMLVRSIGFRGIPVTGLPFDEKTGRVPNDRGRVDVGLYVAGWIKRGPQGFIGSNKACAHETVDRIIDDLDAREDPGAPV